MLQTERQKLVTRLAESEFVRDTSAPSSTVRRRRYPMGFSEATFTEPAPAIPSEVTWERSNLE